MSLFRQEHLVDAVLEGTTSVTGSLMVGGQPVVGSPPTTLFYVDGSRTDSYTPTGAEDRPFTKISSALAAASGAGPYAIMIVPNGSYTDAGPIVGGTAQLEIYGNNSTWTVTGGITLNGPATVYDLNTVGAVTYAYTGATRSERHGGSFATGNVVINGFVHWYGVQLTNTGGAYSVTVNGTLAGDFITGGMGINSGGASALIALNNINLQRASGYNFNMASGGVLALKGGYLTTAAGTFNIYLPTANTVATSHAVEDITFIAGNGISANSAVVYAGWANLSIPPSTTLCPAFYALYNPWPVIVQPWTSQTSKSASVASFTAFTAPIAGLYRITGAVRVTTAGTVGTVNVTVNGEASASAGLVTLGASATASSTSYLAAAGTLTVSTTVVSNTGGVYRVDYVVERLGQ
jgi:hypothetical protein